MLWRGGCALCVSFAMATASLHAQDGAKAEKADAVKPVPVAVDNHVAPLSADNTLVQFVGTHVGDDPRPRLGGFREFSGQITLNDDNTAIESITAEFQIGSLWTEFDDLTGHLKTPDFLDAKKYPTARFESTSIEAGEEEGTVNVTGDLTLHGTTAEVTLVCQPIITEEGITMGGKFAIDRTNFGMDKMTDGVEPSVTIEFHVGVPTSPPPSAPARRSRK
jgi:polyisoprenoid-binding protein YceI